MRPCVPKVVLERRAGGSFAGQPSGVRAFVGQARRSRSSCVHEVRVELAGDVTLQDAHDLAG